MKPFNQLNHTPAPMTIGDQLLACGIQTHVVAIGLAIFSVVTGLVFHHDPGNRMHLMELMKNIAIAGGLLHIAALGEPARGMQHAGRGNTERQKALKARSAG